MIENEVFFTKKLVMLLEKQILFVILLLAGELGNS